MIGLYPSERSFSHFKEAILHYQKDNYAPFLLNETQTFKEYYTPFDYVNEKAKVCIVGITPGTTQWENSMTKARECILRGHDDEDILRLAKIEGAFSGDMMRNQLTMMLNAIGLNKALNIESCDQLFAEHSEYVHATSTLVNMVLKTNRKGETEKYNQPIPKRKDANFFQKSITCGILREIKAVPNAVIIPLGKPASMAFETFIKNGWVDEKRVLIDVPHPSTENQERCMRFAWDGKVGTSYEHESGTRGMETLEQRYEWYQRKLDAQKKVKELFG